MMIIDSESFPESIHVNSKVFTSRPSKLRPACILSSLSYIWLRIDHVEMKQPKYALKAEGDLTIFEFVSEGPKGRIPKLIEFTETNLKDFYNLAFGDKNEETGKISDRAVWKTTIRRRFWPL